MTTTTTCPRCGAAVPPGRRFCLNCGYDLHLDRESREGVTLREWMVAEGRLPATSPVIGRSRHRSSRRRLLSVGVASVAVVAIAVVAREDAIPSPFDGDHRSDDRMTSGGSASAATPMP